MPTFLQAVNIPEWCFLQEVLYWVAFQRLPIAYYKSDARDIRETAEVGEFAVGVHDDFFTEEETVRAGIPTDPDWIVILKEGVKPAPVVLYDQVLANISPDDDRLVFAGVGYRTPRTVSVGRYHGTTESDPLKSVQGAPVSGYF
jgi:hypothetical protein